MWRQHYQRARGERPGAGLPTITEPRSLMARPSRSTIAWRSWVGHRTATMTTKARASSVRGTTLAAREIIAASVVTAAADRVLASYRGPPPRGTLTRWRLPVPAGGRRL